MKYKLLKAMFIGSDPNKKKKSNVKQYLLYTGNVCQHVVKIFGPIKRSTFVDLC